MTFSLLSKIIDLCRRHKNTTEALNKLYQLYMRSDADLCVRIIEAYATKIESKGERCNDLSDQTDLSEE